MSHLNQTSVVSKINLIKSSKFVPFFESKVDSDFKSVGLMVVVPKYNRKTREAQHRSGPQEANPTSVNDASYVKQKGSGRYVPIRSSNINNSRLQKPFCNSTEPLVAAEKVASTLKEIKNLKREGKLHKVPLFIPQKMNVHAEEFVPSVDARFFIKEKIDLVFTPQVQMNGPFQYKPKWFIGPCPQVSSEDETSDDDSISDNDYVDGVFSNYGYLRGDVYTSDQERDYHAYKNAVDAANRPLYESDSDSSRDEFPIWTDALDAQSDWIDSADRKEIRDFYENSQDVEKDSMIDAHVKANANEHNIQMFGNNNQGQAMFFHSDRFKAQSGKEEIYDTAFDVDSHGESSFEDPEPELQQKFVERRKNLNVVYEPIETVEYDNKLKEEEILPTAPEKLLPKDDTKRSWADWMPKFSLPTIAVNHDIGPQCQDAIKFVKEKIASASATMVDMTNGMKKVIDTALKSGFPTVIVDRILMLFITLGNIIMADSLTLRVGIAMQALLGLGISMTGKILGLLNYLLEKFTEKVPGLVDVPANFVAQSGRGKRGEEDPLARTIHDGISELIVTQVEDNIKETVRHHLSNYSILGVSKNISTVKSGIVAIEVLAKYGLNLMIYSYEIVTGKPYPNDKNKVVIERCSTWMNEVKSFVEQSKNPQHSNDLEWNKVVWTAYVKGMALMEEVQLVGLKPSNFGAFFKMMDLLKPIAMFSKEVLGVCAHRILPVWVEIAGDPGIGKSYLMNELIRGCYAAYCNKIGIPFTDVSHTMAYNHGADVKWYDSYKNQFCFGIDDWDQLDDLDIRTSNALNIIKACSPAPYMLPCADIGNIGFKYFDSKMILTTSNIIQQGRMVNLDYKLLSVDALNRRCDFFVELTVNKPYGRNMEVRDPNSSSTKKIYVPDYSKTKDFDKMFSFTVWNRRMGSPTREVWSFQKLMDQVWAKLERNLNLGTDESAVPVVKNPIVPSHMKGIFKAQSGMEKFDMPIAPSDDLMKDKHNKAIKDLNKMKFLEDAKRYTENPDVKKDLKSGKHPTFKDGTPAYFVLSDTDIAFLEGSYIHNFDKEPKFFRFDNVIYKVGKQFKDKNGFVCRSYRPISYEEPETWLETLKDFCHDVVVPVIAGALVAISGVLSFCISFLISFLVIYGIFKMLDYFGAFKSFKAQSVNVAEHTSSGASLPFVQKQPPPRPQGGHFVAQSDMGTETVINHCSHNMFRVWITPKSNLTLRYKCAGFSTGGRTLEIPKHFIVDCLAFDGTRLVANAVIMFYNKRYGVQSFDLNDLKHRVIADKCNDKVILCLQGMKQTTNVKQHLMDDKDLKNSDLSNIVIVGIPDIQPGDDYTLDKRYCSRARIVPNVKYHDDKGFEYVNAEVLGYDGPNFPGMCYYVIFIDNPYVKGKIFGFHAAGDSGQKLCLGQLYSREYNDEIMTHIAIVDKSFISQSSTMEFIPKMEIERIALPLSEDNSTMFRYSLDEEKFKVLGEVPKEKYHRLQDKSLIVPVAVQGLVGPVTRYPANFRPHDGVKPLENSLNLFTTTPEPNDNILTDEMIIDACDSILWKINCKFPMRKLTKDECVNGIPTSKHLIRVDMTKSGGPNMTTLVKPNPCRNKQYKFDFKVEKMLLFDIRMKPETEARFDEIERLYSEGQIGVSPIEDNGKDELRSERKVDLPRIFLTHEVEQLLVGRKYFGTFMENILESRDETGITLGINPYDPSEWSWVLKGHRVINPLFQVGDVSHADRDRNIRITRILNERIVQYLFDKGVLETLEDQNVVRGLLSDISFSMVIIHESLLIQIKGAHFSSGCFITSIMQSLYYKVAFHLAFMSANKRLESYTEFQREVYLNQVCKVENIRISPSDLVHGFPKDNQIMDRKNGDDFINIISSDFAWFTSFCLKYELSTMNVDITPALKQGDFKHFYNTNEIDFLKRMFKVCESVLRAPLDINVIYDVFNWDANPKMDKQSYYTQKGDWAAIEMALYPKNEYDSVAFRIDNFMRIHGIDYKMPTYRSALLRLKKIGMVVSMERIQKAMESEEKF